MKKPTIWEEDGVRVTFYRNPHPTSRRHPQVKLLMMETPKEKRSWCRGSPRVSVTNLHQKKKSLKVSNERMFFHCDFAVGNKC